MLKRIMELSSIIIMLNKIDDELDENDQQIVRKKLAEVGRELREILDVESSKNSIHPEEETRSSPVEDPIEVQGRILMSKLKLAQYFQMAESINKNDEIFNRFNFIDHLKEKINDRTSNIPVEEQKTELENLITVINNYIDENSIEVKKNRLRSMLSKLKSKLDSTSYKVVEEVLEAQVEFIQVESDPIRNSSRRSNLIEKQKKLLPLIDSKKINDEEFWEILQLQTWLTKVEERIEESLVVDDEEFFDAAENHLVENEELVKYKKDREKWQDFIHGLHESKENLISHEKFIIYTGKHN